MRCRACNVELTDYESTRKDTNGEFFDLCSGCYGEVKTSLWEQELTVSDVVQYIPVEPNED